MNQPVPTYTEADLERVVVRDFGQAAAPRVKSLLARYGKESWEREVLRVQMACLKCANGSIGLLEREVEDARRDYRDILSAAEYPAYARARTDEARRAAIESDWHQLQSWLIRR
jgi:hypothetical protein